MAVHSEKLPRRTAIVVGLLALLPVIFVAIGHIEWAAISLGPFLSFTVWWDSRRVGLNPAWAIAAFFLLGAVLYVVARSLALRRTGT